MTGQAEIMELERRFWQAMVDMDVDAAIALLDEPAVTANAHGIHHFTPAQYKAMALSVRLMGNRLAQVALPAGAGALAASTGVAVVFVLSGLVLGASAVGAGRSLGAGREGQSAV